MLVNYTQVDPEDAVVPAVTNHKSTRGLGHPMLSLSICPVRNLAELIQDRTA
jgi:hypothetical protein